MFSVLFTGRQLDISPVNVVFPRIAVPFALIAIDISDRGRVLKEHPVCFVGLSADTSDSMETINKMAAVEVAGDLEMGFQGTVVSINFLL